LNFLHPSLSARLGNASFFSPKNKMGRPHEAGDDDFFDFNQTKQL